MADDPKKTHVYPFMPVSELYDELEAEHNRRQAAEEPKEAGEPAEPPAPETSAGSEVSGCIAGNRSDIVSG